MGFTAGAGIEDEETKEYRDGGWRDQMKQRETAGCGKTEMQVGFSAQLSHCFYAFSSWKTKNMKPLQLHSSQEVFPLEMSEPPSQTQQKIFFVTAFILSFCNLKL